MKLASKPQWMSDSLYKRFMDAPKYRRVVRPDLGYCIEWGGCNNGHQYGVITEGPAGYQKIYLTHILAYKIWHGPVLQGKVIMHKCDNSICMNPFHLEMGTQRDNILDSVNKGRWRKHCKLTDDDVKDIKQRLKWGERQVRIAEDYNVNKATINHIKSGKRWSHVTLDN